MFILIYIYEYKNAGSRYKFEEDEYEATENEIELSAIHDISEDFLSEEEINYYLKLKD